MNQPPKPLWETLCTTTAVLGTAAVVITVVRAIRAAGKRSLEWLAEQVEKGSALRKQK